MFVFACDSRKLYKAVRWNSKRSDGGPHPFPCPFSPFPHPFCSWPSIRTEFPCAGCLSLLGFVVCNCRRRLAPVLLMRLVLVRLIPGNWGRRQPIVCQANNAPHSVNQRSELNTRPLKPFLAVHSVHKSSNLYPECSSVHINIYLPRQVCVTPYLAHLY